MNSEVCDGLLAAIASAELSTRVDGSRAKDGRPCAREFIRHASAVAEPHGEELRRIDAEITFDELYEIVYEGQISASRVRPTIADPLGRDEDCAVISLFLQAVV